MSADLSSVIQLLHKRLSVLESELRPQLPSRLNLRPGNDNFHALANPHLLEMFDGEFGRHKFINQNWGWEINRFQELEDMRITGTGRRDGVVFYIEIEMRYTGLEVICTDIESQQETTFWSENRHEIAHWLDNMFGIPMPGLEDGVYEN